LGVSSIKTEAATWTGMQYSQGRELGMHRKVDGGTLRDIRCYRMLGEIESRRKVLLTAERTIQSGDMKFALE
jgi:hypothetical protein